MVNVLILAGDPRIGSFWQPCVSAFQPCDGRQLDLRRNVTQRRNFFVDFSA